MAEPANQQDDGSVNDGSNIRIQIQIGEVSSPELYAELARTKVTTRRHRMVFLASLGLLLEKSLMNGGLSGVVPVQHAMPASVPEKPARSRKSKTVESAEPKSNTPTLAIPDDFGSSLLSELSD